MCDQTVKDNRPVNLDLGTISFPITAIASITHRISGVIIFVASAILLWLMDASLESPESYAAVAQCLAHPVVKLILWAIAVGFIYHACAGVKHLIMDFGVGETMAGGILGARLVFGATILLSLLVGVWLW